MVPAEAVDRFRADLEKLTGGPPPKLGVAVSGGPDSLALLLLAAAAYPGRVEAATVDHGLRAEGAEEARQVAQICLGLLIPHIVLALSWPEPPTNNFQAQAREGRYRLLGAWALERDLTFVATGHHVNDQAETILMRLARGSGVSGLAGARRVTPISSGEEAEAPIRLIRPLLDRSREELGLIVSSAGLTPANDPANWDERFDRTRVRALLAKNPWLSPERLADAAAHLIEAEDALRWAASGLKSERICRRPDGSISLDPSELPREFQRRLLLEAFSHFTDCEPPGPKLNRLLDSLREGRGGTLAEVRVLSGPTWRLDRAPPRRDTAR
jgi:tRNA(Ile)-lysidine synthase